VDLQALSTKRAVHAEVRAMPTCPFCAIVRGEIAASFVLREEAVCAFLDVRPVFKGHVLVVPREHTDDLLTLPGPLVSPVFTAVQRVAGALEKALEADGSFVAVNTKISQSVPHLHVHVVPRRKGDGLRGFFWPRTKYDSDEEREGFARRIAAEVH
jgi:histidine triad (HIT) family protein